MNSDKNIKAGSVIKVVSSGQVFTVAEVDGNKLWCSQMYPSRGVVLDVTTTKFIVVKF